MTVFGGVFEGDVLRYTEPNDVDAFGVPIAEHERILREMKIWLDLRILSNTSFIGWKKTGNHVTSEVLCSRDTVTQLRGLSRGRSSSGSTEIRFQQ